VTALPALSPPLPFPFFSRGVWPRTSLALLISAATQILDCPSPPRRRAQGRESSRAVPAPSDAQSPSISLSAASTLAPLSRCATTTHLDLQHALCVLRRSRPRPPPTGSAARQNNDTGHPARLAHARHQTTLSTRERAHTTAVSRLSRSRSLVHPHLHAHRGARLRVCSQPWRSTSRTRTLHPRPRASLDMHDCQLPSSMCAGRDVPSHVALHACHIYLVLPGL
jgi:hypothetical protein